MQNLNVIEIYAALEAVGFEVEKVEVVGVDTAYITIDAPWSSPSPEFVDGKLAAAGFEMIERRTGEWGGLVRKVEED